MTASKSKKNTITKVICAAAAAAVLVSAGSIIASASQGEYDTVVINGEEKQARYVDYGTNVRMWECVVNDTSYCVFVHGDYDKDNNTLYFVDHDDYFLASTVPGQTLNLYNDIDKSNNAAFNEVDGTKYLCITDDAGTTQMNFQADEADGTADGKITQDENTIETYALLPNGAVVNTIKENHVGFLRTINGIFTGKTDFWNDISNP